MMISQQEREDREQHFWRVDPNEAPGVFSMGNLLNKMSEAAIFHREIMAYELLFKRVELGGFILEIGGGQCWPSCMIKHLYPKAQVIGSDISSEAIASVGIWEAIYRVRLDGTLACRSYDIPLPSASVDLIFAFQAAHHFGQQAETLAEAARLLRPGGTLLYLYEPVVSRLLYNTAVRRANRVRDAAYEDLLIWSDMATVARQHGFEPELRYRTDLQKASLKRAIYYQLLTSMPPLRRVLPHASDLIFTKI